LPTTVTQSQLVAHSRTATEISGTVHFRHSDGGTGSVGFRARSNANRSQIEVNAVTEENARLAARDEKRTDDQLFFGDRTRLADWLETQGIGLSVGAGIPAERHADLIAKVREM
jgi:hypothetical protein